MIVNIEDFPTVRDLTYLNSASISLMPLPAVNTMLEFQRKIALGGTIGFDENAETMALEGARNAAASLLRSSPDEVAILGSATDGICLIAGALHLPKDCNVVSTDADFPSVVYPWKRLASEHGFEVRLACNRDGVISEEELEKLVDNKTRVISISHVEYGTGQKFDLGKLAELAHTHDALLVVDATQSAGLVPIDVHREDVDVLVAGGYKGLLGPFGAAILYVRQDLVDEVMPPFAGWRSTPIPYALDATKLDFAPGARKFEYSTMSYASAVGLSASMLYLKKLGSDVTKRVAELVDGMIEGVRETERLSGTLLLTPTEENSRASIASFRFKDLDQNTIALELVRKRVIVSQRFNGVRFSFHAYNSKEDVTHAIDSLSEIVAMTS